MESFISAKKISKRYSQHKGKEALSEISFEVPAGCLFGVVGPDGAGKTTLLRILSTVFAPSSGTATLSGFDLKKDVEEIRRMIGYMPQEFSQYPDLSLYENLEFFADIHRVPLDRRKDRIEKMLAFTQLKPFESRKAGKLSGGMKKKLALGCAMVHEPQILILDELSTGVDPVSRRELWSLLSKVISEGVTVLLSTPYMDEAERCSEVLMLYDGRTLTSGAPRDLTAQLPFEMIEVKASPRKLMRKAVQDMPDVLEWHPVGDRLRLAVASHKEGEHVSEDLRSNLAAEGASLQILRFAPTTMEDVFIHHVNVKRKAA
ncbi:MAG: ABC transporter ATP-binding protein [Anaerolineaceae bacterium]|nr:ABC transporter ATP-binding protein [Anaerolineaceae bacterium]